MTAMTVDRRGNESAPDGGYRTVVDGRNAHSCLSLCRRHRSCGNGRVDHRWLHRSDGLVSSWDTLWLVGV
jgi:hypothetical protein